MHLYGIRNYFTALCIPTDVILIYMPVGDQTISSNCSDGDLRLTGKVTATSGRLEVCYNRAWGTVCSYGWGSTDSRVACRQLGFQPSG